ncbi:MAG TPA: hypothetical protein VGF56_07775 [Rhizomicrobium sp.]|jgi:hypothetical protein
MLLAALLFASPAFAGAWTQDSDHLQLILGATYSGAGTSFGPASQSNRPARFQKLWTSVWAEYGLNDRITLILAPEWARAKTLDPNGQIVHASDFAWGGGVRWRVTNTIGTLSLQAMAKSAGAFDMSVSVGGKSGEEAELRLLYGANFKFLGANGFADFEVGERWIGGRRPNETPIDLTLGFHAWHDLVLLQSFNTIAGGDARPPYTYYRSHKLELSWVSSLGRGISVQSGVYFCPAGQNALDEVGTQLSVWVKL